MAAKRGDSAENAFALAVWAYLFWLLITWTATVEQLLFGAGLAFRVPLNGYASLGLIHEGLKDEAPAYRAAILAQVVTIAALARAAYLGFLRRRDRPYETLEPPPLGMRVSLVVLAGGCVAFGIAVAAIVDTIAGPAASVLLHPARYAAAVLSGGAGELCAGLVLAALVVKRGAPRILAPLQRLHTGSSNDYAMFSAVGLTVGMVTLLLV